MRHRCIAGSYVERWRDRVRFWRRCWRPTTTAFCYKHDPWKDAPA